MNIQDISLVRTCDACPEQYNAVDKDGNCIAYLRLRHGSFTVECPDVGGKCVYCAEPHGDGIFEDSEREMYLNAAKQAIVQYYSRPTRESTISVSFSCFAPSVIMKVIIPEGRDEEEYIDELLDAILNEEFRYNCEWDFV